MGREVVATKSNEVQDSIIQIIDTAISGGVSTIHIEPASRFTVIRFRRGSKLSLAHKLPKSSSKQFADVLKKLAGLNIRKKATPQFGSANVEIGGKTHEIEITTLPVMDGEKLTINILDSTKDSPSLDNYGLWGDALIEVQRTLAETHGLVIISSLQINTAQKLLASMFAKLTTSSHSLAYFGPINLRLDPSVSILDGSDTDRQLANLTIGQYSVLGVGLINSSTTARHLHDLVSRGQHIVAVLPAKNTASSLAIWQQMVERPFQMSLIVSLWQAPGLCSYCAESYAPTIIEKILLNDNFQVETATSMNAIHKLEQTAISSGLAADRPSSSSLKVINKLYRANPLGCSHCNFSGYGKDINIFEVCKPSNKLESVLNHPTTVKELQTVAISDGMVSLKLDGLIKALRGLIDFETLISVCSITN